MQPYREFREGEIPSSERCPSNCVLSPLFPENQIYKGWTCHATILILAYGKIRVAIVNASVNHCNSTILSSDSLRPKDGCTSDPSIFDILEN